MNFPEAYIQFRRGLINEDGRMTNKSTEDFLRNYMAEFHTFIVRVYVGLPRTHSLTKPAGVAPVAA